MVFALLAVAVIFVQGDVPDGIVEKVDGVMGR
jgi:hypothetical protein